MYLPSPNPGLTSSRTYATNQMPMGLTPIGGAIVYGPEHYTDTQGRASLNVWSAQCQGLRRREHRTEHKGLIHPSVTYCPNARGSDLEQETMDQNTRQVNKGEPPWICGQQNVRTTARDNTGQNTQNTEKYTDAVPEQNLKCLTPPGIKPGPPGWKAGTLPTTPRRQISNRTIELKFCILSVLWCRVHSRKIIKF